MGARSLLASLGPDRLEVLRRGARGRLGELAAAAAAPALVVRGEQVLVDGEKLAIAVEKDFDACKRLDEEGCG